jgi:CubicO group peptidase (beta-lactamase class C family)
MSLLLALAAAGQSAPAAAARIRQFAGPITDWLILGPFENPERTGASDRGAFDVDYLLPIGGEAKARISADTTVRISGVDYAAQRAKVSGMTLDFSQYYPRTDHKLVYAYAELNAPADQDAVIFLGSDDGAKVIVNGANVFETLPFPGRAVVARQDRIQVKLHKGLNTLLVKVENNTGAWGLAVEAFGGKDAAKLEAEYQREVNLRSFQDQEIGPAGTWPGYTFIPEYGGTPKIVWRDVDRVRELAGDIPLTVRWFDRDLNEVKEPKAPGRYGAVVEGKTKSGQTIRRALTFFCSSPEMFPDGDWSIDVPQLAQPVAPGAWEARKALYADTAGTLFRESVTRSETGANLLAALTEAKPNGGPGGVTESPEVLGDDYQLALKLKVLGLSDKVHPLAPPAKMAGAPAPTLHAGSPAEAGVKPEAKERIDALCRQWAEDSGEPFAILVARHGVIITHAAFGKAPDGTPVTLDYRKDVASITKAVSGMLFSQFVDQGFVAIDDPIGKVLPGFPTTGSQALTFRHLFTHTSGLEGHGNWGGIHNPYLENVVLNGLDALHPGEAHKYNGMGYDLAGKAMEMMTGKSIVRLFHEQLFRPMGIGDVPMADLAYGARLTAYQLGALGQCLANHGRYGDKRYCSEATFEQMLPKQLSQWYPKLDIEWGMGLVWYRETKAGAPTNSKDPKDLILGEHVIGHGSASSCILRVDLDNDLVIAQIRATAGPKYDVYLPQFLTAIGESLL